MYRTVIANVMGKECRDEAGRTLTRIGNMPVRAGDAVWTDGRCIYGNELFGSDAPMLFSEESLAGIPLNAAALVSLLVYSKDHSIQRLGWPKWNSYFANNEKWYAIVPTAKRSPGAGSSISAFFWATSKIRRFSSIACSTAPTERARPASK